jgi:hypothetical protein
MKNKPNSSEGPSLAGMIVVMLFILVLTCIMIMGIYNGSRQTVEYIQECYKGYMYNVSSNGVLHIKTNDGGMAVTCT